MPPIKITCGKCKREFHMPENFQAPGIKCVHCGASITVSAPAPAEQVSAKDVARIATHTKWIAAAAMVFLFAVVFGFFWAVSSR